MTSTLHSFWKDTMLCKIETKGFKMKFSNVIDEFDQTFVLGDAELPKLIWVEVKKKGKFLQFVYVMPYKDYIAENYTKLIFAAQQKWSSFYESERD
jgi:hypothetical protein